jgi:hypothetical protein
MRAFIEKLASDIGISPPECWATLADIELARRFLLGINRYFFQTYKGIGTVRFQDEELQYFSEFHKYWEGHHEQILNPQIDRPRAVLAARAMDAAFKRYGCQVFSVQHNTRGLNPRAIAQVRFFTSNQDFREPPTNQYGKYLDDPTKFGEDFIERDPEDFLRFLGTARLSQSDKRVDFARNAARFLLDRKATAFEICQKFGNDAVAIRQALVDQPNMGYGFKKANMFIRDMVELGVWLDIKNFAEIDVASDINTMKLALRTGILKTDIPLVSSFLDIFCYQYGCVDSMSAKAWRTVWEEWRKLPENNSPSSPCQMDFLIYRIGREYCKDNVVEYHCERGHSFYHFNAQVRICRVCSSTWRSKATPGQRFLPCQIAVQNLPRDSGQLLLDDENLLAIFGGICIFEGVCSPKAAAFRLLEPPKSISVKGQTSWTNSYSDRERGGGGMMG